MTARYLKELANLHEVYEAALELNIAPLRAALEGAASRPAVMLGSGGSYSVASFAAFLHQLNTGRIATASTPLDYMTLPLRDAAVMCFSASGRNKDICAAFDEAAQREAKPLLGLVLRDSSPLHELGARYRYSRVISASSELFDDGFLAVASLLGSGILLFRAYRALVGNGAQLPSSLEAFFAERASTPLGKIVRECERVVAPATMSVLYSSSLKPASVDIESRFVEAALGNVHSTDLRNFGHGRHHWFAKHPEETGLLALIGDGQESLASRTLDLIPDVAPKTRIDFSGPKDEQALAGLIVSLHLAAAAGRTRRIDPAKPGVPEFGRRLYHLGPSKRKKAGGRDLTETAVWRKEQAGGLKATAESSELHMLCQQGIDRLNQSKFAGLVFDYDGTLCEPDRRFEPLPEDIADGLNGLLAQGAAIGIATGRGGSAADRIREAVRKEYWGNVIIGFYNGAAICSLSDPSPTRGDAGPEVVQLEKILRSSRHFSGCHFRTNQSQIAISLPPLEEPVVSVRAAAGIVEHAGMAAVVSCSSHSIDVTFGNAKKSSVVDAIRARLGVAGNAPVLRIGDKGRWPGNDAELLDDPFGLSVDEVSDSLENCWGLSPRGILGVQATLYYFQRIHWKNGAGSINFD
ncbi:HAD hydrolase family protein [Microbacteriaceae bacterium K1510]|nr:HAD hydrolase family protein [Microbacteriaceae bacterium K1510]